MRAYTAEGWDSAGGLEVCVKLLCESVWSFWFFFFAFFPTNFVFVESKGSKSKKLQRTSKGKTAPFITL